jgi:hypothetical protein
LRVLVVLRFWVVVRLSIQPVVIIKMELLVITMVAVVQVREFLKQPREAVVRERQE